MVFFSFKIYKVIFQLPFWSWFLNELYYDQKCDLHNISLTETSFVSNHMTVFVNDSMCSWKGWFFSGYKSLHRSIRTGFFSMIIEFLNYISFKFTWLSEREVLTFIILIMTFSIFSCIFVNFYFMYLWGYVVWFILIPVLM